MSAQEKSTAQGGQESQTKKQIPNYNLETEIIDQFGKKGKNKTHQLHLNDLLEFLDQLNEEEFDRQTALHIFRSLDKDEKGIITVQELAKEFQEEQERLIDLIQKNEDEVGKQWGEKTKVDQELRKSQVMEQSASKQDLLKTKLTLNIKSAVNLPIYDNKPTNPYCILECDQYNEQTKVKYNTQNPQWDDTFVFGLQRNTEKLKVVIMNQQDDGNNTFEGFVEIALSQLLDQKQHDQWFKIQGRKDQKQGQINIIMH